MTKKIYVDNEQYVAGMTLKNPNQLEQNNMALHVCESEQAIIENRKQLATDLGWNLDTFVCANQTHSDHFHQVTKADVGKGVLSYASAIQDTDALYTYEPNVVLCTFTADCVPVLFYHETTGVIGAIHSGWQGTIKSITKKLLTQLIEKENNHPAGFQVYIGMALSQEKFEVDQDVYEKFAALAYADECIYYREDTNKFHIDNQLTVKKQCELVGIPSEQITVDRLCTFKSAEGFSYRENKQAGRHASFIVKK